MHRRTSSAHLHQGHGDHAIRAAGRAGHRPVVGRQVVPPAALAPALAQAAIHEANTAAARAGVVADLHHVPGHPLLVAGVAVAVGARPAAVAILGAQQSAPDASAIGIDTAQQKLQEVSISKFEDNGFWRVYMPIVLAVLLAAPRNKEKKGRAAG